MLNKKFYGFCSFKEVVSLSHEVFFLLNSATYYATFVNLVIKANQL